MTSPSLVTEWVQPGAVMSVLLGLAGFFWAEFKEDIRTGEARQNKRFDEFREEQNRRFDEINEGIREIRALVMQQQNSPIAKT